MSLVIPFAACMVATATFYDLPPRVLPAIQLVEGGRPGTVQRNSDGSEDLGVMQVNTRWIGPLAAASGAHRETVRQRLVDDPCYNIAAAGAILRTALNEARGDLMLAVGYYHSHTPIRRQSYLERVVRAAASLFGSMP